MPEIGPFVPRWCQIKSKTDVRETREPVCTRRPIPSETWIYTRNTDQHNLLLSIKQRLHNDAYIM